MNKANACNIAVVMAIGFITFHSLPDAIPFLGRLTIMVAAQIAAGETLRREEGRAR